MAWAMPSPKTPIAPAVRLLVTTGCAVNCAMYQVVDCCNPCDKKDKSVHTFNCVLHDDDDDDNCHIHVNATNTHCQGKRGVTGVVAEGVGRIMHVVADVVADAAAVALNMVEERVACAALVGKRMNNDTMASVATDKIRLVRRVVVIVGNPERFSRKKLLGSKWDQKCRILLSSAFFGVRCLMMVFVICSLTEEAELSSRLVEP